MLETELARFRAIIENSKTAFCLFDADGHILEANTSMLALSRRALADVQGRTLLSAGLITLSEDDNALLRDALERVSHGHTVEGECRNQTAQGEENTLSFRLSAIKDSTGKVTFILFEGRHSDRWQKLDATLDEEKVFLATILDSVSDAIIACDAEGHLTLFNQASRVLHRKDISDIPPEKLAEFYDLYKADGETPLAVDETPLLRALEGERIINEELIIKPHGEDKHVVKVNGTALIHDEKTFGAVVTLNDISEERKVREALKKGMQRFAAIYNSQPDAIICIDLEGRITECNPAAIQLFGYDEDELAGRRLWILLDPQADSERVLERLAHCAEQKLKGLDLRLQKKDGHIVEGFVAIAELHDAHDRLEGYTLVVDDLSEMKAAERALQQKQRQLAESRESERLKFARELHDGAIQHLLYLKLELESNTMTAADTIAHITDIVQELRSFISELRPINLEELGLQAAIELLIANLERKEADRLPPVQCTFAGDLTKLSSPIILCLYRAVQEALNNVARHARASEVRLSIKVLPQQVVLVIEDNGIGFKPPDSLSDMMLRKHFGLVGLEERAVLLGGQFVLHSQLHQGTELSISLPLKQETVAS